MFDFNETCCVCLKANVFLAKIGNNCPTRAIGFVQKLSSCVPEVKWESYFVLCQNCTDELEITYTFREKCLRSDSLRQNAVFLAEKEEDSYFSDENCTLPEENDDEPSEAKVKIEVEKDSHVCELCNREFTQEKYLKLHKTTKHRLKKTAGKQTDVSVVEIIINEDEQAGGASTETKQKTERKSELLKSPIICEFCKKDFKRKQHFLAHMRNIHPLEKPYGCDVCSARFTLSQNLSVHKRRHINDKQYTCTYCGKCFLGSDGLLRHTKIHLNKREYKCDLCDKGFNSCSILREHKICVHQDSSTWKYPCTHCERRFPIKSALDAHLRRHTGEKKFVCDICGKGFYDKIMVQRHYRSHTNVRTFKCEVCAKEYKDVCTLNIHLKKVHDIGNAAVPKQIKKFVCHVCAKDFVSNNKLQKHLRSHTGERPFVCNLCDKRFADSWYLKVHLKTKHNVNENDLNN